MIDWYSAVKIKRATKNKSVETFTSECLGLKTEILETLKRSIGKCRLSKAMWSMFFNLLSLLYLIRLLLIIMRSSNITMRFIISKAKINA